MAYDDTKKKEALALLSGGKNNHEVSRALQIPVSTVKRWATDPPPVESHGADQDEKSLADLCLVKARMILNDIQELAAKDQASAATAVEKLVGQFLHLTGKPTEKKAFVYEGNSTDEIETMFAALMEEELDEDTDVSFTFTPEPEED